MKILLTIVLFFSLENFAQAQPKLIKKSVPFSTCIDKNGHVYSCFFEKSKFRILVWTQTKDWEEMGGEGTSSFTYKVENMVVDTFNNIFVIAGSFVYQWNGSLWNKIWNNENEECNKISIDQNNNIILLTKSGGDFKFYKWEGSKWIASKKEIKFDSYDVIDNISYAFYDNKNKLNVYKTDRIMLTRQVSFNRGVDSRGTEDVNYLHPCLVQKINNEKWNEIKDDSDFLSYPQQGSITNKILDFKIFSENEIYILYKTENQKMNSYQWSIIKYNGLKWKKIIVYGLKADENKAKYIDKLFKGDDGFLYFSAHNENKSNEGTHTDFLIKYNVADFQIISQSSYKIENAVIDKSGNKCVVLYNTSIYNDYYTYYIKGDK